MHARRGQLVGAAAGEDVHVMPVQRAVALIGLGLPDPRAFLGGVLGAENQYRGEGFVVAEHGDRSESEVPRVHRAQLRQMQCAVGLHALDDHGQLVHVRHDPRRGARYGLGPVTVIGRPGVVGRRVGGDVSDQVSGVVGPHVVDDGLQFTGDDGADLVLLPTRPVGPQEFLQQLVGGVAVALRHEILSVIGFRGSVPAMASDYRNGCETALRPARRRVLGRTP